jgi:hypothetical protein
MSPENLHGVHVEGDAASAGIGLRTPKRQLVPSAKELTVDGQASSLQVEVSPAKPKELAAAHAGGSGKPP